MKGVIIMSEFNVTGKSSNDSIPQRKHLEINDPPQQSRAETITAKKADELLEKYKGNAQEASKEWQGSLFDLFAAQQRYRNSHF